MGTYTDYILEHLTEAKKRTPDALLMQEEQVDFSAYVPEGFGTADCILIADGEMQIFDLKYGKGVPVDAAGNPQIRLYALGALCAFDMLYDIQWVTMHIIQPRLDSITSETLTFAYTLDDDPVVLFDLTKDVLPEPIARLLTDPRVTKMAYNANFERTCLSHYLGVQLPPEQWQCTMVHAATLGLPRTLAEVGRVLGLPEDKQKMKEGKALIEYFCKPCKPTKKNGGRLRNLPEHDVEKWETFKSYNARDVEVERCIRRRMEQYPLPQDELEAYWMDQRINDRGVLVDPELIRSAKHSKPSAISRPRQRLALTSNAPSWPSSWPSSYSNMVQTKRLT